MKKLKLMALGLMFLMIQSVVAVTLPTTSYTPYAGGGSESSEVVFSSGSMVTGSYLSLGDYPSIDVCTSDVPDVPKEGETCEGCCESKFNCTTDATCWSLYYKCVNSCETGPSLPLDGGLSILLVLALGSGAVRVFRKK